MLGNTTGTIVPNNPGGSGHGTQGGGGAARPAGNLQQPFNPFGGVPGLGPGGPWANVNPQQQNTAQAGAFKPATHNAPPSGPNFWNPQGISQQMQDMQNSRWWQMQHGGRRGGFGGWIDDRSQWYNSDGTPYDQPGVSRLAVGVAGDDLNPIYDRDGNRINQPGSMGGRWGGGFGGWGMGGPQMPMFNPYFGGFGGGMGGFNPFFGGMGGSGWNGNWRIPALRSGVGGFDEWGRGGGVGATPGEWSAWFGSAPPGGG